MAALMSPARLWRQLAWEWRRQRSRLPWIPALTLGFLLATLMIGSAIWQDRVAAPTPQVVQALPHHARRAPEVTARAALDNFYTGLPPANSLSAPIAALLRLGVKHSLHFSEGEYHAQADTDSRIVREDIILPASAAPADIQAFVAEALQSLRALTLSGISFERDDARATQVKARIHFVLMARAT